MESIRSARRAATLLAHPLRTRILVTARSPVSASDLARTFGLPRQRVNYHVQQLARDGFLKAGAQKSKRNMVEKQYVASAKAYVVAPNVLGGLAPQAAAEGDAASAERLVALCAHAQGEVAAVTDAANAAGVRVRMMSLQSQLRFDSAEQRAEFTEALVDAVSEIAARHSLPHTDAASGPARGRPFRLILACYPVPAGDGPSAEIEKAGTVPEDPT